MANRVLSALLVLGAAAGTSLGGVVRLDGTQTGLGWTGGFKATQVSGNNGVMGGTGGTANSIMTFCLELGEFFTPGQDYNTVLNNGAVGGGPDGNDNTTGDGEDVISKATAQIYWNFRNGVAIDGIVRTVADGAAIQDAIWYLENEGGSNNSIAVWAASNFGTDDYMGTVVRVLNTQYRDANGNDAGRSQDMLTIVPLPPSAYAGMGTLAAVFGIGYLRRRNLAAV